MENVHIMDGARFSVLGNCVINSWQGPPLKDHLVVFDQIMAELSARHAAGVLMMVVLDSGSPIPTASQRRDGEAAYARWGHCIRAVAQVVEGTNLWAMTARSIMTAMRLVQRRTYPIKVFSDVREAAVWSIPHLELTREVTQADHAELLLAEIAELRAMVRGKVA
jgi:hypothetical protein